MTMYVMIETPMQQMKIILLILQLFLPHMSPLIAIFTGRRLPIVQKRQLIRRNRERELRHTKSYN